MQPERGPRFLDSRLRALPRLSPGQMEGPTVRAKHFHGRGGLSGASPQRRLSATRQLAVLAEILWEGVGWAQFSLSTRTVSAKLTALKIKCRVWPDRRGCDTASPKYPRCGRGLLSWGLGPVREPLPTSCGQGCQKIGTWGKLRG